MYCGFCQTGLDSSERTQYSGSFTSSGSNFTHDYKRGRAVVESPDGFQLSRCGGGGGGRKIIYVTVTMFVICQVNRRLSNFICSCGHTFMSMSKPCCQILTRVLTQILDGAYSNPVHQSGRWNVDRRPAIRELRRYGTCSLKQSNPWNEQLDHNLLPWCRTWASSILKPHWFKMKNTTVNTMPNFRTL
jgi:hypothetical protein